MRGSETLSVHTSQPYSGWHNSFLVIALTILAASLPRPSVANAASGNPSKPIGDDRLKNAGAVAVVDSGEVKARIVLTDARALSGQQIGVIVDFDVAQGWHVYGKPLPQEYTPTNVTFDKNLLSEQNLEFPKPTPVKFALLGETLPVYQGRFTAVGTIVLRHGLNPGEHRLNGTLSFQECNDNLCKMPRQTQFEIPLWIESPPGHSK
ncbi:MAG TPA: protein-disulfide reductase DsbD domain-containing protein [Candidatus Binataceae bacterium]|nr:protein-disulfide reductase DsbD domain-containing protein [Candidatus Binataceae bacterium]